MRLGERAWAEEPEVVVADDALDRALQRLTLACLGWMFVYLVLQGQDGFFATTVERVDVLWVQATFLDVPLQIALTLVMALCAGSSRRWTTVLGVATGAVNMALIAGHVVLSFATA